MAEARRMQFEIGNFADTQFIAALANSIQDAQLKIGVIDLSNMYIGYMGPRNLADTLSELSRVAHKNTILLGTMLTFSAYFYTNTWVERLGSSYHLSRFISYIDKYSKHYAADIMIGKSKSPDIASELKQFNDFEIEFSLHKSEANHLIHLEFVSSCQKFFL